MVAHRMHAGLADYLARNNVSENGQHDNGSVHLVFDNQYRIAFTAASNGALLLESRVCELPVDRITRQSCLISLLEKAGDEMYVQMASLVLPQDGNLLTVQQLISAEAGIQEFEQFLEKFINLLAGYRSLAGVL